MSAFAVDSIDDATEARVSVAPNLGLARRLVTGVTQAWTSINRAPLGLYLAGAYLVVVLVAVFVPQLISQVDPTHQDLLQVNRAPSAAHIAGTDYLGRDVFSRVIYGARYSLLIGLGATGISAIVGVILGVSAGIAAKWVDTALMRFVDILASFPSILLALVVIALIGPGLTNLIIALGVSHIPSYARVVRAQTLQVIRSGYVEQARTLGLTRLRLTVRHVLPNALGVVPVLATIGLGGAIIGAAALSFIGMGPQPPTPEWGAILSESRSYLRIAWWTGIFPGIALTLTVITSTVLGRAWQTAYERRGK
ncbi:MAG: ABC transporter permease [Propionibacteriaceae bacterium]|jgi:peptide/nickel transport system permease protein|nr:ABC transporter permease [Propionibacteriaceae bacterium]